MISTKVLSAAITETRTQLHTLSPTARLGWLTKALDELGFDSRCLAGARKLTESERDLTRRQHVRQARAQQALRALVDKPDGSLDEATAAYDAESAWLDVQPGQECPPAVGWSGWSGRLAG